MELKKISILMQFIICVYEKLCPQKEHSVVSDLFKLTIELFIAAWDICDGDYLVGYLALVQVLWSMFICLKDYLKKEWPN